MARFTKSLLIFVALNANLRPGALAKGLRYLSSDFISDVNDYENAFEGDITPTWKTIVDFYGEELAQTLVDKGLMSKPNIFDEKNSDAMQSDNGRWTIRDPFDGKVVIPVMFRGGLFSSSEIGTIKKAAKQLADASGYIKFVDRTTQSDYIIYRRDAKKGCQSNIGRQGGVQYINLEDGCVKTSTIIHELLHALGFWHEQSRPDRDNYVYIELRNVQTLKEHNFKKQDFSRTLGVPYDFSSIMHYPKGAFAKYRGLQTIFTKPNGQFDNVIGQRNGASSSDLEGLKLLYQCVSRARTRTEFQANPCSQDCKCAKNERGCSVGNVDRDNFCMGILVCSNNVCVTSKTTNPRPTPAPINPNGAVYFEYRNKAYPDKCLDLKSSQVNNGNILLLWRCHGGINQKWRIDSNGYLRSAINDNKCIDPRGPSTANGAQIQVWDCAPNYNYQQWMHYSSDGTFRSKQNKNKCIDVSNADGTSLQVWDCNGTSDKVWASHFEYRSQMYPENCIDSYWGRTNNRNRIWMYPCNSSPAQIWRIDDAGFIRSGLDDNKCLVPAGNANYGDKVWIWDCIPSLSHARWTYGSDRAIRLKSKSNTCLDIDNTDGVSLAVYECNGLDDKLWNRRFK